MRRRDFITLFGGAALIFSGDARAEWPERAITIRQSELIAISPAIRGRYRQRTTFYFSPI
jgi:hypothetical protein